MLVFRLLPLALALAGAIALPARGQSLITLYEAARDYDATWQAARAQYDASLARALPTSRTPGTASRAIRRWSWPP